MKKFLLISLLILSTNAFSMNRIVNRATRGARLTRINSILKNPNLLRRICSDSNCQCNQVNKIINLNEPCNCKVPFEARAVSFAFGARTFLVCAGTGIGLFFGVACTIGLMKGLHGR